MCTFRIDIPAPGTFAPIASETPSSGWTCTTSTFGFRPSVAASSKGGCGALLNSIAIEFKSAPHPPFEEAATEGLKPNVLVVHVQPDEGVSLAIGAKVPGAGMSIRNVHMNFLYGGAFRTGLPEAYER